MGTTTERTDSKQLNSYEYWYWTSAEKNMRRCACWHHLRVNYDGLAFNNGWHDADKTYPHADYCNNRSN